MKTVWVLYGGVGWDDCEARVFRTREAAMVAFDELSRREFAAYIDPTVDIVRGGGIEWRVAHYTSMGEEAYVESQRQRGIGLPEEVEIEG